MDKEENPNTTPMIDKISSEEDPEQLKSSITPLEINSQVKPKVELHLQNTDEQ